MKKEIEDIRLITYPRSGQNLFRMLLAQQGYAISSSHNTADFLDKKHVISIVRNPIDSVASAMAMIDFYKKENSYEIIPQMLKKYEETYTWLLENATYIISYEDLTNDPKNTVEYFLDYFSLKRSEVNYELNLSRDDPSQGYLVSSKNVDSYKDALEYTKTAPFLQDAKEIYQKLLFSKWVDGH